MTRLQHSAGPYSLTQSWYVDGTATDVGDVTIGIVDGNGDTIVAAGTATTNNLDGTYSYNLANQTEVDRLKITWTRTDTTAFLTDTIEIVGSFLFTEYDARTETTTGLQTPLASESAYPDARIHYWRDQIADQFEAATGRSWTERYCRLELAGSGGYTLPIMHGVARLADGTVIRNPGRFRDLSRLISVTINGTTQTVSDFVIDGPVIRSTGNVWATPSASNPLNVVVEYAYGVVNDLEARQNGLRMLLAHAIPSDISTFATSWSNEDGSFTRGTAGYAYPTEVWEWLKRNKPLLFA